MSEDAPVNIGAVDWPDADSAYFTVRRMQTKLHHWATGEPGRRFGDLHNLVYDPAFLVAAWERVSTNKGARTPGIDKATAAQIETWIGVEAFLSQIRDSLKSRVFRPVEVRQVMIPKTEGKLRRLGIPTIADRVVQASLKLVLEPIFEADFKPCSYGFRPNRRAQDAISEIHIFGTNKYEWVLECDIKACFDEISHTALMDRLRVRVKDKRICSLVKAFLKSGVLTELGDKEETITGTPQGGILSPLLANIALSALDDHFHQQWYQQMGTKWQRESARRPAKETGDSSAIATISFSWWRVIGTMPRLCARRCRSCSLRWGCGWHRRRPTWFTSKTRASRSSASISAGCASEARRSIMSTPHRPRRPSRRSRAR
jgi:RNA-directed DNA polymerase